MYFLYYDNRQIISVLNYRVEQNKILQRHLVIMYIINKNSKLVGLWGGSFLVCSGGFFPGLCVSFAVRLVGGAMESRFQCLFDLLSKFHTRC